MAATPTADSTSSPADAWRRRQRPASNNGTDASRLGERLKPGASEQPGGVEGAATSV